MELKNAGEAMKALVDGKKIYNPKAVLFIPIRYIYLNNGRIRDQDFRLYQFKEIDLDMKGWIVYEGDEDVTFPTLDWCVERHNYGEVKS